MRSQAPMSPTVLGHLARGGEGPGRGEGGAGKGGAAGKKEPMDRRNDGSAHKPCAVPLCVAAAAA